MAKNESTKPEPKADDQSITVKGVARFKDENELTDAEIVQRRTPDVDGKPLWPADGRFHRSFNVETPRVSGLGLENDATSDWRSSDHDAMHEANKVAVLQEALNLGLHPRSEAVFDGAGPKNQFTGTVALTYSVEVVPASSEEPAEAATAFTPSKALAEQGGSTLPNDAK
jgi:hypothetical protein